MIRDSCPDRSGLTTAEVAAVCDVSLSCVDDWILEGRLRAARPPRGQYQIAPEDLVAFLEANGMPVPPGLDPDASVPALKVVVVDDEPMVRAVVANILEAVGGMEVVTAADGFEAGGVIAERGPDVVVMDLKMPGLDGATMCSRIRDDPATAHTRVLILTGHVDPESRQRIRDCGADGYVTKPFEASDLIEAVRGLGRQPRRTTRCQGPAGSAMGSADSA